MDAARPDTTDIAVQTTPRSPIAVLYLARRLRGFGDGFAIIIVLTGALAAAAGALAATLPDVLMARGATELGALRAMFYAYAALGLISAPLYSRLPWARARQQAVHAPPRPSRRTVYRLAALLALGRKASYTGGPLESPYACPKHPPISFPDCTPCSG